MTQIKDYNNEIIIINNISLKGFLKTLLKINL